MAEDSLEIEKLMEKLNLLLKKQDQFQIEVNEIRREIYRFRANQSESIPISNDLEEGLQPDPLMEAEETLSIDSESISSEIKTPETTSPANIPNVPKRVPKEAKSKEPFSFPWSTEKFIGENLINKVGIVITIIGVAIGSKYAIDNQLVSPLTRIILGYLVGLGLLGFAIRLKKDYEGFSAVLLSGAMAILYFITFMAYSFYGLMPHAMAFALMIGFTLFTVVAALNYNRQVIALIGFVGAYGIPFLLSTGSKDFASLFSYMAIINIGILLLSIRRYWTALFYAAFSLTWLIYLTWLVMECEVSNDFGLALLFAFVFFVTFYLTFMAYKYSQEEILGRKATILLFSNSFIFYAIGYYLFNEYPGAYQYQGLFTLGNALLHFAVSVVVYRKKMGDRNLFFVVAGLVLLFLTLTIPVQLDGNWVTLMWLGEAIILFWIGRSRGVAFYESLSYVLIVLAFFSLMQDWESFYFRYYSREFLPSRAIWNIQFFSSLLFLGGMGFITYYKQKNEGLMEGKSGRLQKWMQWIIPGILLMVLYSTGKNEIGLYWDNIRLASMIDSADGNGFIENYDIQHFKSIWLINYTMLFFSLLSFINLKKIGNRNLGWLSLLGSLVALMAFLTVGLYEISELRISYLTRDSQPYFQRGFFHILIRYLSLLFFGGLLWTIYQQAKDQFPRIFDWLLHLSLLWVLSSELIGWMDFSGAEYAYKLGLSLLWGIYALMMVSLGIWKKKKHLRMAAIVLFALTLIKLFAYDLEALSTISKTIVLVSLGVLLLIISFLYNKYQHLIDHEDKA